MFILEKSVLKEREIGQETYTNDMFEMFCAGDDEEKELFLGLCE